MFIHTFSVFGSVRGRGHRRHPRLADISTDGALLNRLQWNVAVDMGMQRFGDVIESETSWMTTASVPF